MAAHGRKWRFPRNALLVAFVVALLALSGFAWACTPQPQILILPRVGPPGAVLTAEGSSFEPDTPVEIRWNDAGGPKLAEAKSDGGGHFSVQFPVPQQPPGIYMVLALTGETESARIPVEVRSARSPGTSPVTGAQASMRTSSDLWDGFRRAAPPGAQATLRGPVSLPETPGVSSKPGLALGSGLCALGLAALVLSLTARSRGKALSSESSGFEGRKARRGPKT